MKKRLTWKSDFYNSIENCEISVSDISICIDSNINGHFENKLFDATYRIETNLNWQVLKLNLNAVINKTSFDEINCQISNMLFYIIIHIHKWICAACIN